MASLCAAVQRPGQEQCRRGWAGVHFVGRTLVAGAASAAPRDDAHARCPSAGAAMIAIGRCARCVLTISIARPGSAAIFASASIAILAADATSLKAVAARWWAELISEVIDCSALSQPVGGSTLRRDQGRTTGTEADAVRKIPTGTGT